MNKRTRKLLRAMARSLPMGATPMDDGQSSKEGIIDAAAPIFALLDLLAEAEKPNAPDPTPEQIAAGLRGAVTIGLAVVFAVVSMAENLQKLAAATEAQNGIWPLPEKPPVTT